MFVHQSLKLPWPGFVWPGLHSADLPLVEVAALMNGDT